MSNDWEVIERAVTNWLRVYPKSETLLAAQDALSRLKEQQDEWLCVVCRKRFDERAALSDSNAAPGGERKVASCPHCGHYDRPTQYCTHYVKHLGAECGCSHVWHTAKATPQPDPPQCAKHRRTE